MDVTIGERLRHIRTKFGISQRELAKRTGVASSRISLIESNGTNPSVAALERILEGIPICMADFFLTEPTLRGIFHGPDEMLELGEGSPSPERGA